MGEVDGIRRQAGECHRVGQVGDHVANRRHQKHSLPGVAVIADDLLERVEVQDGLFDRHGDEVAT